MELSPEQAEEIVKETIGRTTPKNIHPKNQLGLLKLLLTNTDIYRTKRDIADKLRDGEIFPSEMNPELARRQVVKAVSELERKLQKYISIEASNPNYHFAIEKISGKGIRLVPYESLSSLSTHQLSLDVKEELFRTLKNYSITYGIPIGKIIDEAVRRFVLGDKKYLSIMEEVRKKSPMAYALKGGHYLDKKPTQKKK